MANQNNNQNGQNRPTSLAQLERNRTEYSCGVNAGKRAYLLKNNDAYKKARLSNDPWEKGFLVGWRIGKDLVQLNPDS